MHKVLIVEDDVDVVEILREGLEALGLTVLVADHEVAAMRIFYANRDLAIIAFDGVIKQSDTIGLIGSVARTFKGPKIAMSSDAQMRKWQQEAGCDHMIQNKVDLLKLVEDLLSGLPAVTPR